VCVDVQQDVLEEAQPPPLGLLREVEHLLHVLHVARVTAVQLLQGLGVALLHLHTHAHAHAHTHTHTHSKQDLENSVCDQNSQPELFSHT